MIQRIRLSLSVLLVALLTATSANSQAPDHQHHSHHGHSKLSRKALTRAAVIMRTSINSSKPGFEIGERIIEGSSGRLNVAGLIDTMTFVDLASNLLLSKLTPGAALSIPLDLIAEIMTQEQAQASLPTISSSAATSTFRVRAALSSTALIGILADNPQPGQVVIRSPFQTSSGRRGFLSQRLIFAPGAGLQGTCVRGATIVATGMRMNLSTFRATRNVRCRPTTITPSSPGMVANTPAPNNSAIATTPPNINTSLFPPEITQSSFEVFQGQFGMQPDCPTGNGTGTATLVLNRVGRVAGLTMVYSGLTALTSQHVHAKDGSILWDLDENVERFGDTLIWRLRDRSAFTVQEVYDQLDAGDVFVNLHSPTCPRGELKATFRKVGGSTQARKSSASAMTSRRLKFPENSPSAQTAQMSIDPLLSPVADTTTVADKTQNFHNLVSFGAPAANGRSARSTSAKSRGSKRNKRSPTTPKAEKKLRLTRAMSLPRDVIGLTRLLNQATFGTTPTMLAALKTGGDVARYLASQLSVPVGQRCMLLPRVRALMQAQSDLTPQQMVATAWWDCALNSPRDEICHRVAFALSQQWVVSGMREDTNNPEALAHHYDILKRNCSGNLRQLMEQVTLSAPMGRYLDMLNNSKDGLNENYARELMQLFTIGTVLLRPNGTPLTTGEGSPIPSYGPDHIPGMAKALTGWTWGDQEFGSRNGSWTAPLRAIDAHHDTSAKTIFLGANLPGGRTAAADMKSVLDLLFVHPNFCPFNARRLIQQLVSSNPTPQYIERVSRICMNNGRGRRGDLSAMTLAVLLDDEARDARFATADAFGKLRQPTIMIAHLMKLLRADRSVPRGCLIDEFERVFEQTPLYSRTVFNFFSPSFAAPGLITQANLVSPEFQLLNQTSMVRWLEFLWQAIDRGAFACGGDKAAQIPFRLAPLASINPSQLATILDLSLAGGSFSMTRAQGALIQVAQGAGSGEERVKTLLKSMIASPRQMIQK